MRIPIPYLITLLLITFSQAGTKAQHKPGFLEFMHHPWVDSTLQTMTPEQKIGQLFIIQAYSENEKKTDELIAEIQNFQVGGILFMQGTAANQATITNQLQKHSNIPLLITMDAEWGPGFRLKDGPKYPVQMALGAIQQDSLIYRMGHEIGQQLKRLGVHVNFAPVADVNNNPGNPVINYRSFGENPNNVVRKTWLYAKGMQDAGVLAVAKHFPGHGDTKTDSHLALPVIQHDSTRLNTIELYPFRALADSGIGGMMTAHLQVPALEPNPNLPSSLSPRIIQKKLVEEFGFDGLVVTDGMNMSGVTKYFNSGEAAVRALAAGNDMLEIVPNLSEAITAVKTALQEKIISNEEIDWKCRKVLALKKWLELDRYQPAAAKNLTADLDNPRYTLTKRLLHEQSLTLLNNEDSLLPLQRLDTLRIAVVSLGKENTTSFQRMTANYLDVDFFNLKKNATHLELSQLVTRLKNYNLLICGLHNLSLSPSRNYGTDPLWQEFMKGTADKKQVAVLLGNPYALNFIPGIENTASLLIAYQENAITEELAAQAIFGAININGKLPVNVNSTFKLNDGLEVKKNDRLKYTIPEEAGISSPYLERRIDSLANLGLKEKAYPGCQVLIAVDGKVILHKCYGHLTYEQNQPLEKDHLYDWASITKITGPLPILIKLHGENKYNLDLPFSFYYPPFRNTDKEKITTREILAHQARFQPWISFWRNALTQSGELQHSVFHPQPDPGFNIRVSSQLFMNQDHIQDMLGEIRDSRLLPTTKYTYSDLGFLLFPFITKDLTGQNYESYLRTTFYRPLGASTVTFNPFNYFPLERFVPTENDDYFRQEQLRGFVHDESAAMFGGVSGNAGLFGTANDLAKIMQMYLQYGRYGGEQLLDSASIAEFTRIQYPKNENRRGLGFDKPYIDNHKKKLKEAYPAVDASELSFGHSGYTGTFTWVDPQKRVLFIFFSNRIYPTRNNSKLFDLNIRPAMHQVIYDSLKKGHSNR
ncbi:glycoside hydrolase family 3 N-terminal domain-containing protein [Gaoshiqia sediminis]|uniref:beta-N-acetylhexosaminidase n=1 Tax=Gaoshiqia sediminis TaxID=2986998 RepID=A0AA42C735_9BACT|nr:glycoside hydrolase family 3 N-terminal domain-containing protein [Gaoshiqia sediminis]MCW0481171.1 serine hydrolase [Gaoshiqia sediminis]